MNGSRRGVFRCWKCGQEVPVISEQAGLDVECPHCGSTVSVPRQLFAQDIARTIGPAGPARQSAGVHRKSPSTAAILNFLFCGVGYVYAGRAWGWIVLAFGILITAGTLAFGAETYPGEPWVGWPGYMVSIVFAAALAWHAYSMVQEDQRYSHGAETADPPGSQMTRQEQLPLIADGASELKRTIYSVRGTTDSHIREVISQALSTVPGDPASSFGQDLNMPQSTPGMNRGSNAWRDCWLGDLSADQWTDGTAHFVRYEWEGIGYRLFCRTVPGVDDSVLLMLSWSLQGSLRDSPIRGPGPLAPELPPRPGKRPATTSGSLNDLLIRGSLIRLTHIAFSSLPHDSQDRRANGFRQLRPRLND